VTTTDLEIPHDVSLFDFRGQGLKRLSLLTLQDSHGDYMCTYIYGLSATEERATSKHHYGRWPGRILNISNMFSTSAGKTTW